MNDNKTAHMSEEYDEKVRATIPNYDYFHSETIDLVKTIKLTPGKWLDAIQSHHYLDGETRKTATENCFRMLKTQGVYVSFENIKPFSKRGIKIGLDRWKSFQVKKGKSLDEAQKHADRFGKEYFPITIAEHLQLLRDTGFTSVEVLWVTFMQAGFYAIKG